MATRVQIRRRSKYAGESRIFLFDFQDFPEMASDTISSATVASTPTGPTIGSPTATTADQDPGEGDPEIPSGKGVQVSVSGGTAETSYLLTCTMTTAGGSILVVKGWLDVNAES